MASFLRRKPFRARHDNPVFSLKTTGVTHQISMVMYSEGVLSSTTYINIYDVCGLLSETVIPRSISLYDYVVSFIIGESVLSNVVRLYNQVVSGIQGEITLSNTLYFIDYLMTPIKVETIISSQSSLYIYDICSIYTEGTISTPLFLHNTIFVGCTGESVLQINTTFYHGIATGITNDTILNNEIYLIDYIVNSIKTESILDILVPLHNYVNQYLLGETNIYNSIYTTYGIVTYLLSETVISPIIMFTEAGIFFTGEQSINGDIYADMYLANNTISTESILTLSIGLAFPYICSLYNEAIVTNNLYVYQYIASLLTGEQLLNQSPYEQLWLNTAVLNDTIINTTPATHSALQSSIYSEVTLQNGVYIHFFFSANILGETLLKADFAALQISLSFTGEQILNGQPYTYMFAANNVITTESILGLNLSVTYPYTIRVYTESSMLYTISIYEYTISMLTGEQLMVAAIKQLQLLNMGILNETTINILPYVNAISQLSMFSESSLHNSLYTTSFFFANIYNETFLHEARLGLLIDISVGGEHSLDVDAYTEFSLLSAISFDSNLGNINIQLHSYMPMEVAGESEFGVSIYSDVYLNEQLYVENIIDFDFNIHNFAINYLSYVSYINSMAIERVNYLWLPRVII